jgi:uncharacterized RDD family membrane protein YckC
MKQSQRGHGGHIPGEGWAARREAGGAGVFAHAQIVNPEAVPLSLDLAGLGSRMIALIIDLLIQTAVLLPMGIAVAAAGGQGSTALTIALIVTFFVVWFGYFPFFEGIWNGRTPGKRAQSLRVVRDDGHPVSLGPVLVRNILRLVDQLPTFYVVGVVSILVTRRSQRLGDLAAGTVVIREHRRAAPQPMELSEGEHGLAAGIDASGLTERDYELIRSFLQRQNLDPHVRQSLARDVVATISPRVGRPPAPGADEEEFLRAVVAAYRSRFPG